MNTFDMGGLIGFLYITGIIIAIIYSVLWAFGLLDLIVNSARLAKAAARWLEANCPKTDEKPSGEPRVRPY